MSKLIKVSDFNIERLERLAELTMDSAKRYGATSAEVGLSDGSGLTVTVRLGEIETLEYHQDQTLAITVYKDHCKGSASTSDFSDKAVDEIVRSACSVADFTASDECAGLADKELMAEEVLDLQLYHPWDISAEKATDIATECEDAARSYDERITNSEGATVTTYRGFTLYANSHGFVGGYPGSRHSASCIVIAGQGGRMQRDYWYSTVRDPKTMEPIKLIGQKAAERTVQRVNARQLKTCKVPVLFSPEMARGLLGHFVAAIRGKALYRRASFLLDQKGEAVFPEFVKLRQEPHLPGALGSTSYDNEGVATYAWDLVTDGVLQDYVLDSYAARKLNMQTTGNCGGVHNLIINNSALSQQELLKKMDRGLLVTEMIGHGVNNVTGDYSRGAVGYWVENGEIQYPVEEITVAGNLKEMFKGIVAIGNDVDMRGNIQSGSILIDNLTVAGG